MFIITHKNWFFALSGALVVGALLSLAVFGLKPSIDFTGGTLVQASYPGGRPDVKALSHSIDAAGFSGYSLREAGTNQYVLRTTNLTTAQRSTIGAVMSMDGTASSTIDQVTDVGPTIGAELRNKSLVSITLVMLCIMLFIAFAFRKVSKPISSWLYGFVALITLVFDVLMTVGFFSILGHFTGAQVDSLFVTAALTVLGFSIHDTIVVFDRTRENLRILHDKNRKEPFAETAGHAISQTLVRSINTSVSVILSLGALYLVGPAATQNFALTLLVGIIAGTYSSICLATPLLVALAERQAKK